jgi:predicted hydrocarbon binding protein
MMHGMVFGELQNFVVSAHGQEGWKALLEKADLSKRVYLAVNEYPDAEIATLVRCASEMTGRESAKILEAFGEFIVPSLLKMYGHLLKPEWKTLEVINNTEGAVHTVVRVKNQGAKPPLLKTRREGKNAVVLIYHSPRQMCSLAIGIAHGLARHFKENITVHETQCMHKGAASCVIVFRKVS